MGTPSIASKIEDFARNIYIKDMTGENFIENIIHATNLESILSRMVPAAPGDPILEMGFGEGTITEPLLKAGYRVDIVEGSSELCKDASARFPTEQLRVNCAFFEQFTPAKPYMNILSLHVLEHVDDLSPVISNMLRWLAPEGRVIAAVPNAQSLHRQLAVSMGLQEQNNSLSPRDIKVGHQRVLTLDELEDEFNQAGFEVIERFGYFLKIVPNSMMVDWSPDLIRALTTISDQLPPHLMANIGVVARRRYQ